MGSEWPVVRLGDVADMRTGFPFKSAQFVDDGIRLVRGDNVGQGRLRWDGVRYWPSSRLGEAADYELQADDVILAMDRPWIEAGLKYAAVQQHELPCLLVQRVARLRGTTVLDQRFLKYIIGGSAFTDYLLSVQTGTTIPHISATQIGGYSFALPPLDEQRRIASILGALDDKIELNRQMSRTLDETARAIFKSWFVDSRHSPETGTESRLPAGWSERPLDSIALFRNGLAMQKHPAIAGQPSVPVVKIAQLRAGETIGADRAGVTFPDQYFVVDGDLLFSWSGSLLVDYWSGGRGALNQHLFKVEPNSGVPSWFVFYWIREHLAALQHIAAGKATTMGHIQRGHLTCAMITVPSAWDMTEAGSQIAPLVARSLACRLQSRVLTRTRDALLPRLLSGEVRF